MTLFWCVGLPFACVMVGALAYAADVQLSYSIGLAVLAYVAVLVLWWMRNPR